MQPRQSGFTLTELLVTVALVGVVAAVGAGMATTRRSYGSELADHKQDISRLNARRFSIITDGTPAAAIAAGLPPDVRGVIDAEVKQCPTSNKPPICGDGMIYYIRFTTKTLRANSDLEELQHVDLPHTEDLDNYIYVKAYPTFAASPPTTDTGNEFPGMNPYILANVNHSWRVNCYANATCDAVTYVIGITDASTETKAASYLSISLTGSITTSNVAL